MNQNGTDRHLHRPRSALLRGTALQAASALVFVGHAAAQLAPNAQPAGGQVVAGAASIAQSATRTTINQATQRAAINWQSFNVGSKQTVQFNQPSTSAVALNRVTGPDPSQIAGQIIANGNIIITNPSGVFFHNGAQVNAAGLVVSAPGITNQNFMAGRMVFDQPAKPGAAIVNRGTITVAQAGLAALVAPRVANAGTITARLGHVVLAGAQAATLDLYGDGLVSIDVTKQVTQVPLGRDGKPVTALVTNTGTVVADGGTVQITARAADGIVQNLVDAGGTIRANGVGGRTGRVEIAGIGGSVQVLGRIAADGATGGTVAVRATDTVTLASGARITANGRNGGGTVALGTSIARARAGRAAVIANAASPGTPAGTARRVVVAPGATVSADGGAGAGGTVTTLSTQSTQIDGLLTTTGAKGGVIEASSAGVLALDQAPNAGHGGTLYLDPYDLVIGTGSPPATLGGTPQNPTIPLDSATSGTSYISPDTLTTASQNGAVTISLNADHDLTVQQPVNLAAGNASTGSGSAIGGASLYLHAGHDLTVAANITLGDLDPNNNAPTLTLDAGHNVIIGPSVTISTYGTIALTTTGSFTTDPAGASIVVNDNATLTTQAGITLEASNQITIGNNVQMFAGPNYGFLYPTDAASYTGILMEAGSGITVGSNTSLTVTAPFGGYQPAIILDAGGSLAIGPGSALNGGSTNVPLVDLLAGSSTESVKNINAPAPNPAGSIDLGADATVSGATTLTLSAGANGPITLETGSLVQAAPSNGHITLTAGTAGALLAGTIDAGPGGALTLNAAGPVTQSAAGVIIAADLTGKAPAFSLLGSANQISQIAASYDETLAASTGDVTVVDSIPLTVGGLGSTGGGIQVATGHTITLVADSMTIGPGVQTQAGMDTFLPFTLYAPGGTVAVQPLSTGNPVELVTGSQTPGALSIPIDALSRVVADRLVLGSPTAGPVTVGSGDTLDLSTSSSYAYFRELDLVSGATIAEPAGTTIIIGVLTANGSAVDLAQGVNQIGSLGASSANAGAFALNDGVTPLTVTGALTAPTAISLTLDSLAFGSTASVSAPVFQIAPYTAGRTIELVAGAQNPDRLSIDQSMIDAIDVQTLVLGGTGPGQSGIVIGNPGDSIDLTGHANILALLGPGAVTESDGAGLRVAALAIPNLLGGSTEVSSVTLAGPNQIGRLFAEASGPITLTNSGALQLDVVQSAAAITVTNSGDISISRDSAPSAGGIDGIAAPLVTLTATGGNITFDPGTGANIVSATDTLTLQATGSITQNTGAPSGAALPLGTLSPAGTTVPIAAADAASTGTADYITANTLVLQAGSASLTDQNDIGTLGAFNVSGALTLTTAGALVVAGPGSAGSIILNVGGPLQFQGDITSAGSLALNAAGSVTQSSGSIAAAQLTGTAVGSALFGGSATIDVSTLAGFTVNPAAQTSPVFSLANSGPLTVAGALSAGTITLSASGFLLLDGVQITADQVTIGVTPASAGVPSLVQTGTATVTPASAAVGNLTLVLPGSGSIALQRLSAPAMQLTLDLGTGTATGTIDVATLQIDGQHGSATLNGSLAGLSTGTAASLATITQADPAYTLDGCTIAFAVCIAPPPPQQQTSQASFMNLIGTPLLAPSGFLRTELGGTYKRFLFTTDLITVGIARDPADVDLLLPNISDRDY